MKKLVAEYIGTFCLVFVGCGSALIANNFPDSIMAYIGVAWAFGLTLTTMSYIYGHVSGGHFNPAVSIGACIAGRLNFKDVVPYILAQVSGGVAAAAVLYLIITISGNDIESFAANGFGKSSPNNYSMLAALLTEMGLTFIFLLIILGATSNRTPKGFGGLVIGFSLTVIHLISMPITNTSVNPARSISQALFVGGAAVDQLWLFWLAPITGATLAALVYRYVLSDKKQHNKQTKQIEYAND